MCRRSEIHLHCMLDDETLSTLDSGSENQALAALEHWQFKAVEGIQRHLMYFV